MKKTKKVLSLLLCLMLMMTLLPMHVFAADTSKTVLENMPADAYYRDAALWAEETGIVSDSDAILFAPDTACTRAQAALYLWRAYGAPEPEEKSCAFTDVDVNSDNGKAILWAVEKGIIESATETTFGADMICTRADVIGMIYRNVKADGGGFTGTWMFRLPFTDAAEGDYEAIAWCYKEGITHGTSATTFSPAMECTHAHIVTFLHNALGVK